MAVAWFGTFNSQVKAAGSREKDKNKRGPTYSKIKQDPRGQTSPDEDTDQIIEEFTRNDAVSASAAAAKGVQQTVDAAADHKKNTMSPIREEQLRDGTLEQAINPEHRELIRQIDIRHQAEAQAVHEESSDSDDDECDPPHGIVDSDSEDEDFPVIAMAIAKQKSQRKWRRHCSAKIQAICTP